MAAGKRKTKEGRTYDDISRFVRSRSVLKRDVFEQAKQEFALLKRLLESLIDKLHADIQQVDPRLEVRFQERNDYECAATIAGDYLLFHLHTNVFRLDAEEADEASKAYLEGQADRAYCAAIHVYNFLADSFRFERPNDAGYLAARIFINREKHFAVEGINGIGERFGAFRAEALDEHTMEEVLHTIVYEALNFELIAPEYAAIAELRLTDAIRTNGLSGQRTSKRMGFRLSSEAEDHGI